MALSIVQSPVKRIKAAGRRQRRPKHTFNVRHLPYVIQPFMLAPVRPGETLVDLKGTLSAYSAPLASRNTGGWLEHVFFYVPVTAMAEKTAIMNEFVDDAQALTALTTAANAQYYYQGVTGSANWVDQCMKAVVAEYFRGDTEDGVREAWNLHVMSQDGVNMPIAAVASDGMLDSLMLLADLPADSGAPTEDAYAGTLDGLDAQRRTYDRLRLMGFRELTFEEWLETQGISVLKPAAVTGPEAKPELLRMHRQFVMPANAIDPTDGSAASALVWKKEISGDKDYLFRVPGFILGVTICRFKTYMGRQYSNAASAIFSATGFLPRIEEFREDDALALGMRTETTQEAGPWGSGVADATSPSGDYIYDILDLYFRGDQFVNELTATDAGIMALPTAALQTRYPTKAMMQALFAAAVSDADNFIFQDGRIDLTIMTDLRDNKLSVAS